MQPCFVAPAVDGQPLWLCLACASNNVVSGLASTQAQVPLRAFACEVHQVPAAILAFGENIFAARLESPQERLGPQDPRRPALLLRLFDAAVAQQATATGVVSGAAPTPSTAQLLRRFESLAQHVRCYEDASLQAEARALVPMDVVQGYASEFEASGEWVGRAAFLRGLLRWFKKDFFKWTNKPSCPNKDGGCGRGGPFQVPLSLVCCINVGLLGFVAPLLSFALASDRTPWGHRHPLSRSGRGAGLEWSKATDVASVGCVSHPIPNLYLAWA